MFCMLGLLLFASLSTPAQTPGPRSTGTVMWAVSGVHGRDIDHWIRNFDFHQLIPGIALEPVFGIPSEPPPPEDPEKNTLAISLPKITPADLRLMSEICDKSGCRFFFVVEVSVLSEKTHRLKEGNRENFQQLFRQTVTLTGYRKTGQSDHWEKISPVVKIAEAKDMVGTSDLSPDQLRQNKNRQRCEFMRKESAKVAAKGLGSILVEAKKDQGENPPGQVSYTLTNHSPLPLSSIYLSIPMKREHQLKNEDFLFGGSPENMVTLNPYASQTSIISLSSSEDVKPQFGQAVLTIDGWSKTELIESRSKRKRRRKSRNNWEEHQDLPPSAHEMNWETEKGE
ncbi:hypothetical protein P0Y35_15590 [Kiritimatiellaeota bacterium B1221]|nr:hypothetical protein [Kiritimatiellaeota bacterium B1221]